MMNQWKLREKYIPLGLLIADVLLTVLAWGGFWRRQFGADTLFQVMLPMNNIIAWLQNGRYATYWINVLLYNCGVLTTEHYFLFFCVFLALIALSIWLTQLLFFPYVKEQIIDSTPGMIGFWAATSLLFSNVLFSEHFMFPECHGSFGAAYFLGILGAIAIMKKKSVRGFLCIILSCLFYQTANILTAMLLTAALVFAYDFCLCRALVLKELLYNSLILLIGFLDNQSCKWLVSLGVLQPGDIMKSISWDLVDNLRHIVTWCGELMQSSLHLMPAVWAPFLVLLASLLLLFIPLIRKRQWGHWATVLLCLFVESLLFLLLPVLSDSFAPRFTFLYYALQTVVFLMVLCCKDGFAYKKYLLCLLCGLYLVWQVIACQKIIANRYVSNELDLYYAGRVWDEIQRYQEETGITVTKVAYQNDIDAPNNYAEVHFKRDQINERVLSVSPFVLLEYVNGPGKILEHVPMNPDIYDTRFADRNWDDFNPEEQLIFVGDTLYWIIF